MSDVAFQPTRWLMPGCCCAEMSKAPVSLGPEMSPCQCRWYRCKDIHFENQAGYRSRSVHSAQIPVRRHGQLQLVRNRSITNSGCDLSHCQTAVFGLFPGPQGRSGNRAFGRSSTTVSKTTQ